jgi:hypothetical protein
VVCSVNNNLEYGRPGTGRCRVDTSHYGFEWKLMIPSSWAGPASGLIPKLIWWKIMTWNWGWARSE